MKKEKLQKIDKNFLKCYYIFKFSQIFKKQPMSNFILFANFLLWLFSFYLIWIFRHKDLYDWKKSSRILYVITIAFLFFASTAGIQEVVILIPDPEIVIRSEKEKSAMATVVNLFLFFSWYFFGSKVYKPKRIPRDEDNYLKGKHPI